jgi:hypothetical protein
MNMMKCAAKTFHDTVGKANDKINQGPSAPHDNERNRNRRSVYQLKTLLILVKSSITYWYMY